MYVAVLHVVTFAICLNLGFMLEPSNKKGAEMMKWKSGLDVAANVAILCVCILIGVIGFKKFVFTYSHNAVEIPRKGSRIELGGVNWDRAERTLVLALSTKCHFCNDSADFYRRLAPAAAGVPVVAVFPQSTDEARAHWTGQNLPFGGVEFAQAPTGRLPISGTPTLILVDRKGVVLRAWAGKQLASGEAEIIHAVQQ